MRGADASDAGATFVAVFEGMQRQDQGEGLPVDTYFLVEPPAIAKLISEFATFLTVHPTTWTVQNAKSRVGPQKRRRPKYALTYT